MYGLTILFWEPWKDALYSGLLKERAFGDNHNFLWLLAE